MKKLILTMLFLTVGTFVFAQGWATLLGEGLRAINNALESERNNNQSQNSTTGIYGNPSYSVGRFEYNNDYWLDFGGRISGQPAFYGNWGGGVLNVAQGTYSISGNTLTMNFTHPRRESYSWTIINASTLRDHDGDYWYLQ